MRLFLLATIFILSSCSSNNVSVMSSDETGERQEIWDRLVGEWKGSQNIEEGGTYEWSMLQFNDGKYVLTGKVSRPNRQTYSQTEVGEWGASGDIKFTVFKGWLRDGYCEPADSTNPNNYDVYKIVKLNSEMVEYRDLSDGDVFTALRIGPIENSASSLPSEAINCFAL